MNAPYTIKSKSKKNSSYCIIDKLEGKALYFLIETINVLTKSNADLDLYLSTISKEQRLNLMKCFL